MCFGMVMVWDVCDVLVCVFACEHVLVFFMRRSKELPSK